MSVRWERLFGEPSSFAVRVAFHHDPDEGAAASPEMAASWGAFQIWVRDVNLCAHVDEGETLQYCHWYLLPLLEWLTENWDALLHEERHPTAVRPANTAAEVGSITSALSLGSTGSKDALVTQEACFAWQHRHALRTARGGGIFPDVYLRRFRNKVEVSWKASQLAGAEGVGFTATEGVVRDDLRAVAGVLHDMIESASGWLHAQVPASQRCKSLVESVEALRQPNRSEERAAWLAGFGDGRKEIVTRWRGLRDRISDLGTSHAVDAVFGRSATSGIVLDGCLAPLLFGSASPTITEDDAVSLATLLLESYEESPDHGLGHLVCDEPIDVTQPPIELADPRVLPLHVFSMREKEEALPDLDDAFERRRFRREYSPNGELMDANKRRWPDSAPHGRDPQFVRNVELPLGHHWDVSRRTDFTVETPVAVWQVDARGHINVYADGCVRRSHSSRPLWPERRSKVEDEAEDPYSRQKV